MEASLGEQTPVSPAGKKQKRFQCNSSDCGRNFARLEHLQRHERIHSGVKPFSCNACNYSFTRSDLLVRHERLTHQKQNIVVKDPRVLVSSDAVHGERSPKRLRTSIEAGRPVPNIPSMMNTSPAIANTDEAPLHPYPAQIGSMGYAQLEEFSLQALSYAAEYQSLQGTIQTGAGGQPRDHRFSGITAQQGPAPEVAKETMLLSDTAHEVAPIVDGASLGESLDNLAAFLDTEPLSSFRLATIINTEQPMPFFSPEDLGCGGESPVAEDFLSTTLPPRPRTDDIDTFSPFGSRLPSLQPEDLGHHNGRRTFFDISVDDRHAIVGKLDEFSDVLPQQFELPTRIALCRYLAAYINGFHEHMPFLHIPTMSVKTCSIELLLAIAAIGAQYTFEGEKGVELFNVSHAIATHRIRRRDARLVELHREAGSTGLLSHEPGATSMRHGRAASTIGPLGLPSGLDTILVGENLMQTAQALLLLMALCTWAKHKEILREALSIQSILATLIRDDGLELQCLRQDLSWEDWIHRETIKRTKFIVYGFSNLHCIVYNIPPFMLTSEVRLPLPCSTAEFKASTESAWKVAKAGAAPEVQFQDAIRMLFSADGRDVTKQNSSAGNYALIHALIQHIFFVRQVHRCRFDSAGELGQEDVVSLERALRNWQTGWRYNPESSLDPLSPNGPVAFNSTALLRLAYIRLYVDTTGRALDTRDPMLIANALHSGPIIKRSAKITRAVLHSAHALSIPIKIGYRLVAKTQSFIWSIQHSLCTLECAYLMSKWLEALSVPSPDPPVTEDERRIIAIVKSMLDETEFALSPDLIADSPAYITCLSAGVLKVWATIFKGTQTWAIVDVIGTALNLYADMLDTR